MIVYINKADYSVACISGRVEPAMQAMSDVMEVNVPDNCLDGIPEDEWPILEYDSANNTLVKDPNVYRLNSAAGKQKLIDECNRIALIPTNSRTQDDLFIVSLTASYVGNDVVNDILADNVLSDSEISDILSYLNDSA